jgi:Niemann-Pick C1 protein
MQLCFLSFSLSFIAAILFCRPRNGGRLDFESFDSEDEEDLDENKTILPKTDNDNKLSIFQLIGLKFEEVLTRVFEKLGAFCANRPILVLFTGFILCTTFSCGFIYFDVITDPIELWSPKTSETRMNKNYYDTHFRPFYRTTQVIIRPINQSSWAHQVFPNDPVTYGPALVKEFLHEALKLQNDISDLKGTLDNQTVSLEDICFKPLAPDNNFCTIQSIFQYWQNSPILLDKEIDDDFGQDLADYITHFENCVASPTTLNDTLQLDCLGENGAPVEPFMGLGAYPTIDTQPQYGNATALVITWVINNFNNDTLNQPAMAWEKRVIDYLKNEYKNENVTFSFSTERSIQDELNRESKSDVKTILISYMAMFLYITLTLGKILPQSDESCCSSLSNSLGSFLINMKFTVGLTGVTIVMFSVISSIGLFSYFGVKATLIIFEVIPFLVLAVGVDNIFILVQTYQREKLSGDERVETRVSRVVGKVGPSILLTSLAESCAFLLGTLTPMPAVKIFSLYAAMSVFIDFLLQITCFVSMMTLDAKREQAGRFDIFYCFKMKNDEIQQEEEENIVVNNSNQNEEENTSLIAKIKKPIRKPKRSGGLLFYVFKNYYSKFLLNKYVRPFVILLFMLLLFSCVSLAPLVDIGLDQKLSMPKDSYVLDYFEALEKYLSVGVPLYFVIKNGVNYSSIDVQNLICSTSGCNSDSMLNQITQASFNPNVSHIGISANSWIDDYFDWLSSSDCCNIYSNGSFCPSSANKTDCIPCPVNYVENTNRPTDSDFHKYIKFYLKDNPNLNCAKGGHAAYGEALQLKYNGNEVTQVESSFFMAFHTVGVTSKDFIQSLTNADQISKNITNMMRSKIKSIQNLTDAQVQEIEVFPYSVFYVFYEQYLTVWRDTVTQLSVCILVIFIVTAILLGLDFYTSAIITLTITMIVFNLFGAMYLLNIELNAVSLVNLVMVS